MAPSSPGRRGLRAVARATGGWRIATPTDGPRWPPNRHRRRVRPGPPGARAGPADRTIVPSFASSVGIAIRPEADPELLDLRRRRAQGAPLERLLRGDHRAMVEAVDAVAGADSGLRRSWELLLGELVEAFADIAVRESVIDFPMGTAFWDSFTVEQCRRLVTALASMGCCFDGHAGWRTAASRPTAT